MLRTCPVCGEKYESDRWTVCDKCRPRAKEEIDDMFLSLRRLVENIEEAD